MWNRRADFFMFESNESRLWSSEPPIGTSRTESTTSLLCLSLCRTLFIMSLRDGIEGLGGSILVRFGGRGGSWSLVSGLEKLRYLLG